MTQIFVNYDSARAFPTTRTTGRLVTLALQRANLRDGIPGLPKQTRLYPSNCYLAQYSGGRYENLSESDAFLKSGVQYYFVFVIDEGSGYYWNMSSLPAATINGGSYPVSPDPEFSGQYGRVIARVPWRSTKRQRCRSI